LEKLTNLVSSSRLAVGADGTLHFLGKAWTPRGGGLYRVGDGSNHLVSLIGSDGRHYVATDGPAYQLLPRDQTLPFNLLVLLVFLVPALGVLVLPVVWLVRRLRRRQPVGRRSWRVARLLAAGSAGLGLVFLVALTATLLGNTDEFQYHVPLTFRLLLIVPLVVLAGAAAAVGFTVTGWRGAGVVARIHQVTLLAGLAAFAWFLWQWNLIGWQFG
jgi:hypothetical protein